MGVANPNTGRVGVHPAGAEVREEYVRATARTASTSDMDRGVGSRGGGDVLEENVPPPPRERRGNVLSRDRLRPLSARTSSLTHSRRFAA